jgi:hypothetical protein
LPTLLAEGDRTPFSFLISYEKMMEIMEQPKYRASRKSFVTEDRTEAVFLLRMIEARRTKYRVEVVDDLRAVCRKYGFKTHLVGGIYYLQGRLPDWSPKVSDGLVLVEFAVRSDCLGRRPVCSRRFGDDCKCDSCAPGRCSAASAGSTCLWTSLSAPATNVCIGIAIDSMIHLVFGVRRAQTRG